MILTFPRNQKGRTWTNPSFHFFAPWNQNGVSSYSHLTSEVGQLSSRCHINGDCPQVLQSISIFMVSPVVLAHISPLYDWAWKSRGVGGGGRVARRALNRDSISLSVLVRTDGWIPLGLVAVSVPQILRCKDPARGRALLLSPHSCGRSLNQLQYVFSTWAICTFGFAERKTKKPFLECLCMNLNFKLFLIFFVFFFFNYYKHRAILREKLCKYLIYFISWIQKIYVWFQRKD